MTFRIQKVKVHLMGVIIMFNKNTFLDIIQHQTFGTVKDTVVTFHI